MSGQRARQWGILPGQEKLGGISGRTSGTGWAAPLSHPAPPPGRRGFPACSQGEGPVIPHKADCLQDGNPRAFSDLAFCLATRPAQALIQKSHRTLQATLFVLPYSGHRGLPQFLAHPELPPGQPLLPPGMHIPCFLQDSVRAQLHVTCSKVLPVKAVCYLLCSTNSNPQLNSVCLCVNCFPHCRMSVV